MLCVLKLQASHRDVSFLITDETEIFSPPNENNIHHELNDPVHPWYILESCGLILARLSVMRHYVEWCDVIQQSIQHFHFKSVW